ncbi:MAG: flagellar hook-basal body complex protein [Sulfuricurvum sp.]|uniref:flagellar hook-basal body complex protein n=1 Tax=Sulfuricurvum sp. TaxID=2025608 RepID=UPI002725FFF0|nr:flagellar hook-basal body complex protein [Sulfuricurvum sp.]MDO9055829.1 flagellar hook-basal body complex protein [Sulfuricurvum sp.]
MLRSLFAGVTGLQSHQVAMDVESNNIANVNTIGYKYSRANFSDLLAQTNQIATAPQGQIGGKNAVQIGLGTTVSSVTRIHSQGSIQNTDKNTDVAIQGDGFFIVSSDGGNTYKYSRSGDFKFDAAGNFVDNNGFIVQGWVRDETTGLVDATAPIANIQIPPGLTTPAQATTEVVIKANLSSGDQVEQFKPIYNLDTNSLNTSGVDGLANTSDDDRPEFFNVLFDANGSALNLQSGQGMWTSYQPSTYRDIISAPAAGALAFDVNGVSMSLVFAGTETAAQATSMIAAKINANTATTGVSAAPDASNPNVLILTNDNTRGTTAASKNISLVVTSDAAATSLSSGSDITAFQYSFVSAGATPVGETDATGAIRQFTSTEDLRAQMQHDARLVGDDHNRVGTVAQVDTVVFAPDVTAAGDTITWSDGTNSVTLNVPADIAAGANENAVAAAMAAAINANPTLAPLYTAGAAGANLTITSDTLGTAFNGTLTTTGFAAPTSDTTTTLPVSVDNDVFDSGITVEINSKGQFEIKNPGSAGTDEYDLRVAVTGLTSAGVTENIRFTQNFQTLSGTLTTGSSISRLSQSFNAATHSASIDVFDSLGTKHTLRLDFRKTALNSSGGTEWVYEISVPSPGDIGGTINKNELTNLDAGRISFTNTGALALATIPSLTYTANNGSAPNQTIDLNFGTINQFDGMTSFDNPSGTSGISQDGYPGGDLVGIRIDQSGTLVGSFSNGRSFGLAQIGMAKFSNNEGLVSDGGNVYLQSANSGDPIIGTAATAGRGFMQSSALEASNVDLSKSLTQLIIIQRGYQANGKTITTSDTLLETLIGLKR